MDEKPLPTPQSNQEDSLTLDFRGPFKFSKGEGHIYDSDLIASEGIYIWTIGDEINHVNYVHYIGETTAFGRRQKEHLIGIAGLNYRIIDPDLARQGIEKIVWNGMWRDKTVQAVATLLDQYDEVSKVVTSYVRLLNVYFAPTKLDSSVRKHVEGCLGWNLRTHHPDMKRFYPDDNHVGTMAGRLGKRLIVNTPDAIAGIDKEQMI